MIKVRGKSRLVCQELSDFVGKYSLISVSLFVSVSAIFADIGIDVGLYLWVES